MKRELTCGWCNVFPCRDVSNGEKKAHGVSVVTLPGLLPLRRCGYSKAKQDPEEEKMHFHNGHSKLHNSCSQCVRGGKVQAEFTCAVEGSVGGHVGMTSFIPRCVWVGFFFFCYNNHLHVGSRHTQL